MDLNRYAVHLIELIDDLAAAIATQEKSIIEERLSYLHGYADALFYFSLEYRKELS